MKIGEEDERDRTEHHLPGHEFERRRMPAMAPHMDDAKRPKKCRQHQQAVADHHPSLAPIEAQGIEEHDDPQHPQCDTDELERTQALLEEECREWDHPKWCCVGKYGSAAGRYALKCEIG